MHWVREAAPDVHIHAFSPDEVLHAATKSCIPTREVMQRLQEEGLGSLQGTAAEILVDSVRNVICPRKISTANWIRIIQEAHNLGIRSTATIMYGSYETVGDQVQHLEILRKIQDETHGFTELVSLPYVHAGTPAWSYWSRRPVDDRGKPALSRQF